MSKIDRVLKAARRYVEPELFRAAHEHLQARDELKEAIKAHDADPSQIIGEWRTDEPPEGATILCVFVTRRGDQFVELVESWSQESVEFKGQPRAWAHVNLPAPEGEE